MTAAAVALLLAAALPMGSVVAYDGDDPPVVNYADDAHDWLVRRTDPDAALPLEPDLHRPPDLRRIRLGRFRPINPEVSLFQGGFHPEGEFLRLDVELAGVMNPPGPTFEEQFLPFLYGPNPVYGFIELDMDEEAGTGGELDAPSFRYLGNAVRFGGIPNLPHLHNRFALSAWAFDGDFTTPPYVERSGEEFHLALLGGLFQPGDVCEIEGDNDDVFELGETWWIEGRWFHRAHGYEPFSLAEGGGGPGIYEPRSLLQWRSEPGDDRTRVSLVFPLDNAAAAMMNGDLETEPPNANPSDQFSVHEALVDLHDSALFLNEFPTGLPEEELIEDWATTDPMCCYMPPEWRVTAVLGMSYSSPASGGQYFAWTDIYPDVRRGDVDGDGSSDDGDRDEIQAYIVEHDAEDGMVDGRYEVSDHPVNFCRCDVDAGGVVEPVDVLHVSPIGDADDDGDRDLADFALLQACFADQANDSPACCLLDSDTDGIVGMEDLLRFYLEMEGP